MNINIQELIAKSKKQGLNPDWVIKHQKRVSLAKKSKNSNLFEIIENCSLRNNSILKLRKFDVEICGFAEFIPAAGASSRYLNDLADLYLALTNKDDQMAKKSLDKLRDEGFLNYAISPKLKNLLEKDHEFTGHDITLLDEVLALPKALQPAVAEGSTFLELKFIEYNYLGCFEKIFVVINPIYRELFDSNIDRLKKDFQFLADKLVLLSQGPDLSTIRFDEEGDPIFEDDGTLSVVPAGHGTLTTLFPLVQKGSTCHSILIRNIDNVIQCNSDNQSAILCFLSYHKNLLDLVKQIRQAIDDRDLHGAENFARQILHDVLNEASSHESLHSSPLLSVLALVFHRPNLPHRLDFEIHLQLLAKLFAAPVVTMGQVPNQGTDVGGNPVFININNSPTKICLEAVHATSQDREIFLKNPEKATHFNPVFVAVELGSSNDNYDESEKLFWILAEKTYKGNSAYYHESVLYEILGNSLYSNVVFVDIPRSLFNPHKKVSDTHRKKLSDWISG